MFNNFGLSKMFVCALNRSSQQFGISLDIFYGTHSILTSESPHICRKRERERKTSIRDSVGCFPVGILCDPKAAIRRVANVPSKICITILDVSLIFMSHQKSTRAPSKSPNESPCKSIDRDPSYIKNFCKSKQIASVRRRTWRV